jgi:hypothetical protein
MDTLISQRDIELVWTCLGNAAGHLNAYSASNLINAWHSVESRLEDPGMMSRWFSESERQLVLAAVNFAAGRD